MFGAPAQKILLESAFKDLSSRFFINLPDEELTSFERLFFQVEQAFWFYEDFYSDRDHRYPKFKLKAFANAFFHQCPILSPHLPRFEELFNRFLCYVGQVPVCGCILLSSSMDKVLMVKAFKSDAWGFPKGKINHQEKEFECAQREVFEEVGFDCRGLLNVKDYLQTTVRGRWIRMYIIRNVPEGYSFNSRMRKEIREIRWFPIRDLPSTDGSGKIQYIPGFKFWEVLPFCVRLKRWIGTVLNPKSIEMKSPPRKLVRRNGKDRAHTPPAYDSVKDEETFGSSGRWYPEAMFRANKRLGVRSARMDALGEPISDQQRAEFRQRAGPRFIKGRVDGSRRRDPREQDVLSSISGPKLASARVPGATPGYLIRGPDEAFSFEGNPDPLLNFRFDSASILKPLIA
jgi:8-oxo-dGTP pyrophosphatase MutT (NUDIX family)